MRSHILLTNMDDEVVSVLPIHYSETLVPNVHLHQFPLLSRPLQIPPSAALSGKRIRARVKTVARKLEISVPVDTRTEVWNNEKGREFGVARSEDDREKNQETDKGKQKDGEGPRLTEVRLRSEQIPQQGVYMLGIVYSGMAIATIVWFSLVHNPCQAVCTSFRSAKPISSALR